MKLNIVYKKQGEWFIGHIQEYPDYESQGKTVNELGKNLIEIFHDINEGLVPDAEPFQLLEVAVWKEPNWLKQLSQTVVFSYAMDEDLSTRGLLQGTPAPRGMAKAA